MDGKYEYLTPRPSWLRAIRKSKKITTTDVAEMCKISRGSYSYVERGLEIPKGDRRRKIAQCLGFDVKLFDKHPLDEGCVPLDWLKLLRLEAGWYSIEKFSFTIDVSFAIYKAIEKGNFLEIAPEVKQAIADKLGFPVSYFDNPPKVAALEKKWAKIKDEPKSLPPWRKPEYTAQRQAEKERCRVENEARLKRASEKRSFMAVDASGNVSGGWLEYVTSNDAKMRRYE